MRTDLFRRRAICLLSLLTALCILTSCGSKGSGRTGSETGSMSSAEPTLPSGSSLSFGDSSAAVAHFPNFEIAVPADWAVRGNVGKVYEGEGMFLLAGPLDSALDLTAVEAALAEELELFFNTEYYRSQVRFESEKEYENGAMHRLSGTLYNDRDGGTLRFAGCFRSAPGLYCFYFWSDSSRDRDGERYMETTYESIRIL